MGAGRELLESTFEKFSSTTVIRVFNFISTSTLLVERLFWVAVLLGFSFGTVWNVTNTIQTFLAEPTASRVSFLANSTPSNMSFPDAALCLEMRSDMLVKMYESKIDNVVKYIDHKADFSAVLKEKLAKVHEIEDERSAKLANFTANASLSTDSFASVSAYHHFDAANRNLFSSDEVAVLGLTTAMLMRLLQLEEHIVTARRFPMPSMTSIQRLYKAYRGKRTNFSELLVLTAELMCALLQIRLSIFRYGFFTDVNDYTGYNVCKYSSLTYFGLDAMNDEVICYRMADGVSSPLTFHSGFDQVILSLHLEPLYRESSVGLRRLLIDPSGKYALRQQPPLILELNERQAVNFSLETVSTSVNLRRSGCWHKTYPTTARYQCVLWCQVVEARLFTCNCLALYSQMVPKFAPLPDKLESCALIVDEKLENFRDDACRLAVGSFNNCSLQCYDRNCDSLLFSNAMEIGDPSLAYLNASTVVRLQLTKFVYQKIDEYVTMDLTALITSLGGNLSLYLGASFLALIHILVFLVKLPFEVACKSKESANSTNTSVSSTASLGDTVKALVSEVSSTKQVMTEFRHELASLREHVDQHRSEMIFFRQHIVAHDRRLRVLDSDRRCVGELDL